jgi:hypothetical protein
MTSFSESIDVKSARPTEYSHDRGHCAHLDERRRLIDPARALGWDRVPSWGSLAGDTVYVAAVDADGNAASLVHSLYGVYGAAVVAGGLRRLCMMMPGMNPTSMSK